MHKRPDALFHLPNPIATDFTIVFPSSDFGIASAAAAQAKVKIHTDACAALNVTFYPAATEIFGHIDEMFIHLIDAIAKQLPFYLKYSFKRDAIYAISTSLEISRSIALQSLTARQLQAVVS